MQTVSLEAEIRERVSEGKLNILRKSGWVPVIVYGGAKDKSSSAKAGQSVLLKIEGKKFLKAVGTGRKSNTIVELKWGAETANVVVKEVQKDIVSQDLLHIDFQRIVMTEKLEVAVPVHIEGEAPGVKLSGGTLEHITREVKILCLPKDIPAVINVDISKLEIGQGVYLRDLPQLPGVEYLSDPGLLVVHVVAQVVIEEVAAVAAPASTEPEVIAKGKKPEEGEAAAAATPAAKGGEKAPAAPAAKGGAAPAGK